MSHCISEALLFSIVNGAIVIRGLMVEEFCGNLARKRALKGDVIN